MTIADATPATKRQGACDVLNATEFILNGPCSPGPDRSRRPLLRRALPAQHSPLTVRCCGYGGVNGGLCQRGSIVQCTIFLDIYCAVHILC